MVKVATSLLAGFLAATTLAASGPELQVGDRFPDLMLPALDDGRPLRVSDFRGQKLILHVFASW